MIPLQQTQLRFQRYVIDDAGDVVNDIAGPDAKFRSARLKIYQDAYRLRLIEALATDYELLKAFVGEQAFDEIARDYIAAQPSVFRNLRWFGGGLADFLHTVPRYASHGVLIDLAEFEWTLGLAFDAPDAPALAFDQLTALPLADWPRVTFSAHPSLHLIRPRWNVTAIWHALNDGAEVPAPTSGEPTPIVIWRKELSPRFRSMDADEAALWLSIRAGTTFAAACEELAVRVDADAAPHRAAGLLRSWVDDGWLTRFELAG
jgi:hypothetical protein